MQPTSLHEGRLDGNRAIRNWRNDYNPLPYTKEDGTDYRHTCYECNYKPLPYTKEDCEKCGAYPEAEITTHFPTRRKTSVLTAIATPRSNYNPLPYTKEDRKIKAIRKLPEDYNPLPYTKEDRKNKENIHTTSK